MYIIFCVGLGINLFVIEEQNMWEINFYFPMQYYKRVKGEKIWKSTLVPSVSLKDSLSS